jgi:hypothetical protein
MATWLTTSSFADYPQQGRELAVSHLSDLQRVPVALLPVFLVDLKAYDWKFPVEQREIAKRIEFAGANPSSLAGFGNIQVPTTLDNPTRIKDPQRFLADMTTYLWSSLQMDAYRAAANRFVGIYSAAGQPDQPLVPRLVMVCIGRDAQQPDFSLFQKLHKFGQLRTNVRTEGAAGAMLAALHERAKSHPAPYAHWYVDGGNPLSTFDSDQVTHIFYPELAPLNQQILARMKACIEAGSGPEVLHIQLAELNDLPEPGQASLSDPRLHNFAVSLLTEGSGTQLFSTSFVQWTTREVLRRAQPTTLLVRFAPRQRQKSFNTMVAAGTLATDLDPAGSLIDADMAAYYAYLEMQRLSDSEHSTFLAWFENHPQAFIAGRGIAPGSVNDSPTTVAELLSEVSRTS